MTAEVLAAAVPGTVAEVITGDEEAALSFHGAVAELDCADAPFLVVDLGGGSTELVLGSTDVDASFSADIGCVRLTERCLHSDPPTAIEVAPRVTVVRWATRRPRCRRSRLRRADVGGSGGHFHHVSALAQRMATYDSDAIHLSRVGFDELSTVCDHLIGMTARSARHSARCTRVGST